MRKIIGIEIQLPYHNEKYMIGEEILVSHGDFSDKGKIINIEYVSNEETEDTILIKTEKGFIIGLSVDAPGIRVYSKEQEEENGKEIFEN